MKKIALKGPEIKPFSGGKPKQLVILLHGLGANGEDLISLAPEYAHVPRTSLLSHSPSCVKASPARRVTATTAM